ncbi:hypothetical protein V8E51_013781 [Hyaloscypha variabilis]
MLKMQTKQSLSTRGCLEADWASEIFYKRLKLQADLDPEAKVLPCPNSGRLYGCGSSAGCLRSEGDAEATTKRANNEHVFGWLYQRPRQPGSAPCSFRSSKEGQGSQLARGVLFRPDWRRRGSGNMARKQLDSRPSTAFATVSRLSYPLYTTLLSMYSIIFAPISRLLVEGGPVAAKNRLRRIKERSFTYSQSVLLGSRDTKAHSWKILKRKEFVAFCELTIFASRFSRIT